MLVLVVRAVVYITLLSVSVKRVNVLAPYEKSPVVRIRRRNATPGREVRSDLVGRPLDQLNGLGVGTHLGCLVQISSINRS